MKSLIRRIARHFNVEIRKIPAGPELPVDFNADHRDIYSKVSEYTMTSPQRIHSLIEAVKYIERYKLPGDIVECGVWKGGSMMAVAETLKLLGCNDRDLYLYDTYEGMPPPGDLDRNPEGKPAVSLLETNPDKEANLVWAYSTLETVKSNMETTGYPGTRIHYIKGKVEDSIPGMIPGQIALLRLDTDWYTSTLHELNHLFPRLVTGGILIIDDYGFWQGARKAVDEYFNTSSYPVYLHRIDDTGRLVIKQH